MNWWQAHRPRRLPVGRMEFDAWVLDIVFYSGLPVNDNIKRAAAQLILMEPPTRGYMTIASIGDKLIKLAANQVASEVLRGPVQLEAAGQTVPGAAKTVV